MNGKRENWKYRCFGWKSRKKQHMLCVYHTLNCFGSPLVLLHSSKWLRQFYTTNTHTHNATERLLRIKSPSLAVRYMFLSPRLFNCLSVSFYLSLSCTYSYLASNYTKYCEHARARQIHKPICFECEWMSMYVCACWNKCEQKMLTTTMDFVLQRSRDEVLLIEQLLYVTHIIPYELQLSYFQCMLISLLNVFLSVYAFFSRCVENMLRQKKSKIVSSYCWHNNRRNPTQDYIPSIRSTIHRAQYQRSRRKITCIRKKYVDFSFRVNSQRY